MIVFKNRVKEIRYVLLLILLLNNNVIASEAIVVSGPLMNFRQSLASLMGGFTTVEVRKNIKGIDELFIINDKHYAVTVNIYNNSKLFATYIASPNHKTNLDSALELLTMPLKVDYASYFDGTFMSTLTSTGLTDSNLPSQGVIEITTGNRKAMAVTAISVFAGSLDFAVSGVLLANGQTPKGLVKYLKYILFYDAITNQELINQSATILSNIDSTHSDEQVRNALMSIKDAYIKYLSGRYKEILGMYLYSVLEFDSNDAINKGVEYALNKLKIINLFDKLGNNVLVPLNAIYADLNRGNEVIISRQFFNSNSNSSERDKEILAQGLRIQSVINKKLIFLYKAEILEFNNVFNYKYNINPDDEIRTEDFIRILSGALNRVRKKIMLDSDYYEIQDNLYIDGTSIFKENILLKDAIFIYAKMLERSYPNKVGNMYPFGNNKRLKVIRYIRFLKKHKPYIKKYYPYYYNSIKLIHNMTYPAVFNNTNELGGNLTNKKTISLIYDYLKYHHIRNLY